MKHYTWNFKINPAPASRCRVTRWGGRYYGKVYTDFREAAAKVIPKQVGVPAPLEGPMLVRIQINCRTPKKPSNPYPTGDFDNYTKAILDACNGIVWADDRDIVGSTVIEKRYSDDPCVILSVYHFDTYEEASQALDHLHATSHRYLQRLAH